MIELMIVLIIIGILAAASVPIYRSFVSRAYTGEIVSACSLVKTAVDIYRAEHGSSETPTLSDLEGAGLLSGNDFSNMHYVVYDTDGITLAYDGDNQAEITWDTSADSSAVQNLPDDFQYASVKLNPGGSTTFTLRED